MAYKRPITEYWAKYYALLRNGLPECAASRIAHDTPVIYA